MNEATQTPIPDLESPPSAEPSDTILVVDDNNIGRSVMCRILETAGHTVRASIGGEEALSLLADAKFGLVLLDLYMPDPDGFEVLARARKLYSTWQLPILMISASDTSEDIVAALDAGANDYFTRPIDKAVLLAKIRQQLSLQKLLATLPGPSPA